VGLEKNGKGRPSAGQSNKRTKARRNVNKDYENMKREKQAAAEKVSE